LSEIDYNRKNINKIKNNMNNSNTNNINQTNTENNMSNRVNFVSNSTAEIFNDRYNGENESAKKRKNDEIVSYVHPLNNKLKVILKGNILSKDEMKINSYRSKEKHNKNMQNANDLKMNINTAREVKYTINYLLLDFKTY
jgi:hypothetical protein